MYVKQLNQHHDTAGLGQKCVNLAALTAHGFNVPPAIGVTFQAFEEFIHELIPRIQLFIADLDAADASRAIRKAILAAEMPADVMRDIKGAVSAFPASSYFAVRSSGMAGSGGTLITEDSATKSLAGQYESFLRVPQAQVVDAVKRCWSALYNERSLRIFRAKEDDSFHASRMSVVIQLMINADTSAVVMSRDPLEVDDVLAMEATFGPCEALVSGSVTGDLITIDRKTRTVVGRQLGGKKHRVHYDAYSPENRGTYRLQPNTPEESARNAIDDTLALRIANLAMEVEARFGQPQDIELVVAKNEIYLVQTRNITTPISKN